MIISKEIFKISPFLIRTDVVRKNIWAVSRFVFRYLIPKSTVFAITGSFILTDKK